MTNEYFYVGTPVGTVERTISGHVRGDNKVEALKGLIEKLLTQSPLYCVVIKDSSIKPEDTHPFRYLSEKAARYLDSYKRVAHFERLFDGILFDAEGDPHTSPARIEFLEEGKWVPIYMKKESGQWGPLLEEKVQL